jgi:DNA-binding NarL/FixJ family response regulator
MSGMDGIELLRTIREERPNLPFVLFTGKGSEEIASEAISAGVTDYLQKRGGTEQFALLANRVANAVEGRRAAKRWRFREDLLSSQEPRL